MDPKRKLIRATALNMEKEEARALVDLYYQMQEHRKATQNQARAIDSEADTGSSGLIRMVLDEVSDVEENVKLALDVWTRNDPLSAWARGVKGIGPVLAAGLAAHIDVTRSETAGGVWRFAGLDPTSVWNRGQKRPYNARLKTHAWKIGDSFVRTSGLEGAFYGQLYRQRKEREVAMNLAHQFSALAKRTLETRNIRDPRTKRVYESGMLPDGRIDLRARRWAVKLFLAHYWEEGRKLAGLPVPVPYPIAILGHAHIIDAPEQ